MLLPETLVSVINWRPQRPEGHRLNWQAACTDTGLRLVSPLCGQEATGEKSDPVIVH